MDLLIGRAEALGLRVVFRNLGRCHGQVHSSGLVYINSRGTVLRQRVTLAHEMGHWHHGHDWSREHNVARDEREADQYAARLLIPWQDYARVENLCEAHPGAIARELGVTQRLVELRREDFERDVRTLETVEQWRAEGFAS